MQCLFFFFSGRFFVGTAPGFLFVPFLHFAELFSPSFLVESDLAQEPAIFFFLSPKLDLSPFSFFVGYAFFPCIGREAKKPLREQASFFLDLAVSLVSSIFLFFPLSGHGSAFFLPFSQRGKEEPFQENRGVFYWILSSEFFPFPLFLCKIAFFFLCRQTYSPPSRLFFLLIRSLPPPPPSPRNRATFRHRVSLFASLLSRSPFPLPPLFLSRVRNSSFPRIDSDRLVGMGGEACPFFDGLCAPCDPLGELLRCRNLIRSLSRSDQEQSPRSSSFNG